jgi:hypothetical protein
LSRRMPALFTRTSTRPNASTARLHDRAAPAAVATESWFATASPPALLDLGDDLFRRARRSPPSHRAPPRSFTTTLAPSRAKRSACARPMPAARPRDDGHLAVEQTHDDSSVSAVLPRAFPRRLRRGYARASFLLASAKATMTLKGPPTIRFPAVPGSTPRRGRERRLLPSSSSRSGRSRFRVPRCAIERI